jgi:ribosomal-protein-alanine N-acetyltransferase
MKSPIYLRLPEPQDRSACLAGYYAFAGHERQGFMCAGLKAVMAHAFGGLQLHRLEANIQPGNGTSIALVRGKIRGRWCDHQRWAILADRDGRGDIA